MTVNDFIRLLNECEHKDAKASVLIVSKTDVISIKLKPKNVSIDYDYSDNGGIEYSIEIHTNDSISVE